MTNKDEYCKAWHGYWADRDDGASSFWAIMNMIDNYGGVARKQPKMEINGIYLNTLIPQMMDYIQESIENALEQRK